MLDTVVSHVAGRVPVVAGTTAEGLRTCIDYSRRAKQAGAAAVMISPPRMAKINSDAVAKHYAEVAAAVDLPIIVQDYPPISGYAMEPALLARIARDVPAARTDQARRSADAVQDEPHSRPGEGAGRRYFRRARRRLPARGTARRRGRRDDRVRVSQDARAESSRCFGPARSTRRPTSSTAACR